MTPARVTRLTRLFAAAARLANREDPIGRQLRLRLEASTDLTAQGIDWALARCLEPHPDEATIEKMLDTLPNCAVAHVVLSSNVFVAPLRAIAIALLSADEVYVKPSRRAPDFTELLSQAAPGLFHVTTGLHARANDHVWAYGSDDSLRAIAAALPPAAVLHAHGFGFGVAVIDVSQHDIATYGLCEDVIAFDQRGCLSPRILVLIGSRVQANTWLDELLQELAGFEQRVPRGTLHEDEKASLAWYRATMRYVGEIREARGALCGIDWARKTLLLPPPGRNLHVCLSEREGWARQLAPWSAWLTTVGCSNPTLEQAAASAFPRARLAKLGKMQMPPLDGPVDQRGWPDARGALGVIS